MAGNGAGQQKSSKSFLDLLLSLAAGGRPVFSFESSGPIGPMMDSLIKEYLSNCLY